MKKKKGRKFFIKEKMSVNEKHKLIENKANEISFRLLATNKHADYNWLIDKLKKLISENEELNKNMEK